jgi:hypothetical protein
MRNNDFRGVSPSQLDAMSCRLAWHLGYRLGYRSLRLNPSLDLGIGIHAGLEAFYSDKSVAPAPVFEKWCRARRKEINPQWVDDLNEMASLEALGMAMLEGYTEHYGDDPDLEVIATEHMLTKRIPIPDSEELSRYTITARLDGIVRDENTGKVFSLEHKTFSRLSTKHFDLDHQFTAQVWLGQDLVGSLGIEDEVIGVIFNGLRKQTPGPRVKDALFVREKIYRNQAQIDSMLHRAYWQCREMSSKSIQIYPQPNPIRCQSCNFREVCIEWQRGGDYQFILDEFFISREAREARPAKR